MFTFHPLEAQLREAWSRGLAGEDRVLVAVSGGPDSVALLRAMVRLSPAGGRHLAVAHFNHGWRGEASDADERFVVELAGALNVVCHVGRQTTAASPAPDGLEAAARDARYAFLRETAESLGIRYVATGHTADDQAETILHHILRGTSILGLAGMSRIRLLSPVVTLVRPLLEVPRAEVLTYLDMLGQTAREDATNADRTLMRNRIRHDLLPLLQREYAPAIVDSLLRLGQVSRQAQAMIEPLAAELLEDATITRTDDAVVFDCRAMRGKPVHLVREMFVAAWRALAWPRQAMGLKEWQQVAELAMRSDAEPAAIMLPGIIRAERTSGQLKLSRQT